MRTAPSRPASFTLGVNTVSSTDPATGFIRGPVGRFADHAAPEAARDCAHAPAQEQSPHHHPSGAYGPTLDISAGILYGASHTGVQIQAGMLNRVLVVCVGNICRSPMAEAMLRARLGRRPRFEVSSAGVGALVGHPADPFAMELMRERGLDIAAHRARQVTPELVAAHDLVLAAGVSSPPVSLERRLAAPR